MAYESVKNQIDAYIKANRVQLITGPILNAVLTAMLDNLGKGYAFQGVLSPADTPVPAADIPQAWMAAAGTYIGGAVTVDEGELALITHTADGWDKVTVYAGNTGDIPQPSDEDPLRDGTAEAGTSDDYARGDHRHPTDTSRAPVDNPEFNGKILIKDDEVVEIGADGITRGGRMYAFPDNYGQLATTNETPFLATYGVTTYGDIYVAIQAGRQVFAVYRNYRYQLEEAIPGTAFKFTRTGDDGTVYCAAVSTNNVWSRLSVALAPKASPQLTGTPTAPTAPKGTNTTQIATTAFVQKAVEGVAEPSSDNPLMDGIASSGESESYARGDHRHPSDTSKANVVNPSFEDSVYVGPPSSALSGSSSLFVEGRHVDGDFGTSEYISLNFNYATDWSPNVRTSRGELRFNARETDVAVITKGGTVAMLSDIPQNVEQTTNKVNSLSAESTDSQYPSAKCVYDAIHPAVKTTTQGSGMEPNKLYRLGTLTGAVTFTLGTPSDPDIVNHYYWTFETGGTTPAITWPAAITKWNGGGAPIIAANKHYEVSVLDGVAAIMEA